MTNPGDDSATVPRPLALRTTGPDVAMPWLPTLFQNPYADQILTGFRWRAYLRANPDVAEVAPDEAAALRHFYYSGYYERRIPDRARLRGFDAPFYRERYPGLGLASDAEAQIHYCYLGQFEGRAPNAYEAWHQDADLHVFQMGKVGSHSIAAALEAAGTSRKVIHLHWVSDFHLGEGSLRTPYRQLLLRERAAPLQVISASREIVSWTLASLFQYFGDGLASLDEVRHLVEVRFLETAQGGLTWFDHRYFCGLDVYATPFPHGAGVVRIAHPGLDLLVYRQENLPGLSAALGDFLSTPGFTLGHHNVGGAKGYSALYREFRRGFRLPGNVVATLYDSPYMRHFYSHDERDQAYRRWVG